MLILHYTGMQSAEAAIARLRDPAAGVSSHYVIDEDGTVLALVPEDRRAWHAGISNWRSRTRLNDVSIGIEIVNPGHEWGYRDFPEPQMAALRDLCLGILARHAIPGGNVVGHSDVAPDRKDDPGERFGWEALARAGIGIWPAEVFDRGTENPVADGDELMETRQALAVIGYAVATHGPLDLQLATVVRAFQRHWRPEAVTGLVDVGTRHCAAAVSQLISPAAA